MKPSPAPWSEFETDDGDFGVKMDNAHSVIFGNLEGSCGICHANARLTSLAPELLEVLDELVDVIANDTRLYNIIGRKRYQKASQLIKRVGNDVS